MIGVERWFIHYDKSGEAIMAERRMFAKTIIDSDAFLEMPPTTQNLYFHLAMRADDDGFINRPKTIMRICGARDDDMSILIAKRFIIPFDTGIVVIKHWKIHNYIQRDRYKPTVYQLEKGQLVEKPNKSYTLAKPIDNQCIQNVSILDTQVRLGKDRIGKDSIGKDSIGKVIDADAALVTDTPIIKKEPYAIISDYKWIKLTQSQYDKLKADYPNINIDNKIKLLDEYVQSNGNKNKYKDFNLVLRKSIRENWFNGKRFSTTKNEKAVPDWFDKHLEEAKKRDEENRKAMESEENLRSLEELEEFFNTKKKAR